jgi:hypothetical protein
MSVLALVASSRYQRVDATSVLTLLASLAALIIGGEQVLRVRDEEICFL